MYRLSIADTLVSLRVAFCFHGLRFSDLGVIYYVVVQDMCM